MTTLRVEVEHDHLERLVRRPLSGLTELLWNAVDADASVIRADLERNRLGGVDALVVSDNGTGISREQATLYFSHLGGSWKKTSRVSDGGRVLHGQAGQGRWAAFGIGEVVSWTSVADQVTGERAELRILGRRGALDLFDVSDLTPAAEGTATGTVVRVEQLNEGALRALEADDVLEKLTTTFALTLQQHPVTLYWRGTPLDPKQLQRDIYTESLQVEGVTGPLELVIIEWKQKVTGRSLHLCDSGGASLHEMKAGIQAPGFTFTAYLRWDGFHNYVDELALSDLGVEPLSAIVTAAKDAMRRYFNERASKRGTELVQAWKADSTYPYAEEPTTEVEQAERELFEIVAVAAAEAVENVDPRARKLSLRLMREALENSPGALHEVLHEVLELPAEHVEELRALLETTNLSGIIKASRQITDRLDFLMGLEELVFNPNIRKEVLERSQLHRILANETWIFREEYALTADDVTLTTALRQHIAILGREDLAPSEAGEEEVLDSEGRRVVVDLMLSRVVEHSRDHREHVVIELKRPIVHIGMEQISQVTKYAQALASDSRFAQTDTRWEFWIVGDTIDESAKPFVNQRDREPGVFMVSGEPQIICRAVTWAKILQDARHRLAFVKSSLSYSATTDSGLAYLRRTHSKYLPSSVTKGAGDDASRTPAEFEPTVDGETNSTEQAQGPSPQAPE